MVSHMGANPMDGLVSQWSRAHQGSRQTLYRWSAIGRQALEEALGKHVPPMKHTTSVPTLALTMVIETHANSRDMQSSLRSMHGISLSVGRIAGIVTEAGQRAHNWVSHQQATTPRTLALDEHDSSQRGKASLHVMDVQSGHVWASVPPVEVDGERWTLVVWSLHEHGISRVGTVSDGGRAIQEAVSQVQGEKHHQRDVWHLFPVAAHVQGRLDRTVKREHDRVVVIQRQAEREAEGRRARGRRPKATVTEQQALVARMSDGAESVRDLCQEWHTVLEVVGPCSAHVLTRTQRHGAIDALLDRLDEVPVAIPAFQKHFQMLSTHIRLALPQTLVCARRFETLHEHASHVLGAEAVTVLAWAWLRRATPGPPPKALLHALTPAWRAGASDRSRMPGRKPSEPAVLWNTGSASSDPMWPFIARCRLACSLCWRSGRTTGWLLAVFMRVCLLSNGRDRPHPIPIGWQLWTLLLWPPDCSHVSHGFEPCLR